MSSARESEIETLAYDLHDVYNRELDRQGVSSKHARDYIDLPENIKDLDRALARFILTRDTVLLRDERARASEPLLCEHPRACLKSLPADFAKPEMGNVLRCAWCSDLARERARHECECTVDNFCDYHRTHPEEYAKSVARERASAAALLAKITATFRDWAEGTGPTDRLIGYERCAEYCANAITTDQAKRPAGAR
jgi:hypothetical protein